MVACETLVEELHGHTGGLGEPLPELSGFQRFLAFAAVEVDRQADDEQANCLFFNKPLKTSRVLFFAAARVVLVGASNLSLGIADCDADPHRSKVDPRHSSWNVLTHGRRTVSGYGLQEEGDDPRAPLGAKNNSIAQRGDAKS